MSEVDKQKQIEALTKQYQSTIHAPFEEAEKSLNELVKSMDFELKKTQILFRMIESESRDEKGKLKQRKNSDPYFLAKHLVDAKTNNLILAYALLNISKLYASMIEASFNIENSSSSHLIEQFWNIQQNNSKTLDSKIASLTSDIASLKRNKLIEISVPKKVEKALKAWSRQFEASQKASKQYVG